MTGIITFSGMILIVQNVGEYESYISLFSHRKQLILPNADCDSEIMTTRHGTMSFDSIEFSEVMSAEKDWKCFPSLLPG